MIHKVLYVHYQRSERDGSFVHTREFEAAFGEICNKKKIEFKVVSPPLLTPSDAGPSLWARIKSKLSRFYIRDFKALVVQLMSYQGELDMLRSEKPDVVLTRYNHARASLSILWACRQLKIPVVIELNSPHRDSDKVRYYRLPYFLKLFSPSHALSLANGLFAVSNEISEPLQRFAQAGQPVRTIPNGVDIKRFDPSLSPRPVRQKFGIPDGAVVFGFVGSFAPWHGIDLLVDAFSTLLKEKLAVHLLLVGQTNPQWQSQIDRLATPELAPHVSITGFVRPEDIPPYLAAMDVTTLPNQADYCSPLKLFEYMAMARPTVSVNIRPVAATLEDNKEGLLFPVGDVIALTNHMRLLATDSERRRSLGEASRARVQHEFTWRHNAEHIFLLLNDVYTKAHA